MLMEHEILMFPFSDFEDIVGTSRTILFGAHNYELYN